jgi:hypothetical protein
MRWKLAVALVLCPSVASGAELPYYFMHSLAPMITLRPDVVGSGAAPKSSGGGGGGGASTSGTNTWTGNNTFNATVTFGSTTILNDNQIFNLGTTNGNTLSGRPAASTSRTPLPPTQRCSSTATIRTQGST